MPQRMRGFWVCNVCNAAFDRQEEAEYHEDECRTQAVVAQRKNEPPRTTHATYEAVGSPASQEFHRTADPSPQQTTAMSQSSSDMASQYYLLLDPRDTNDYGLASADRVACRNLQLFQNEVASAHPAQPQHHYLSPPYRVGLVCRRCASLGARLSDSELSMPRSVASMIDAVYSMAERHLQSCELLPEDERRLIHESVQMRMSAQAEGGHRWQHEEGQRRRLGDFLKQRCAQLGITNRYPENSGVCFAVAMGEDSSTMPTAAYAPHAAAGSMDAHHQDTRPRASPPQGPSDARDQGAGPRHSGGHSPQADARAAQHGAPNPHHTHHQHALLGAYATPAYLAPEALAMRQAAAAAALEPTHPHPAAMYHPAAPPHALPPHHPPPVPFELPTNFPYFQDPYDGDWLCKYCSHVHPQYRDVNYRWSTADRTPPPGDFIDHHLTVCRPYLDQQQQMTEYYQHRQADPHSPYPFAYPPQDVVAYSTAPPGSAAAGYHAPPQGNPEISPMTPANSYAAPYDAPSVPHGAPDQLHLEAYQHAHDAKMSSGLKKMGPAARRAVEYLADNDRLAHVPDEEKLVKLEDKLLLTDFLFYLMKQLQVVRFSEGDRKTRGGKRENINLGFGGLQCIHCAETQKSRKFFWSGVDRLANSFAEIPSHVFKCKECPNEIKDALTALKEIHPDQMSRLPRGSQKVFFRRVWKRIHDDDPPPTPTGDGSPRPPSRSDDPSNPVSPVDDAKQSSPGTIGSGTAASDESPFAVERPTKEAARALAESRMHAESMPLSPSSRILLSIAEDRDFLSDQDCFLRKQLEVFCATKDDITMALREGKAPIQEGQVGLRCIHCAMAKHGPGATGNAVIYPYSIHGIFEAVREFQRVHLTVCENFPPSWKTKLDNVNESTTISSIQRKYYSLAAKGLGLQDYSGGVRAGYESVPVLSQAVFSFSEPEAQDDWRHELEQPPQYGAMTDEPAPSRDGKRPLDGSDSAFQEGDGPDAKRPHRNLPMM